MYFQRLTHCVVPGKDLLNERINFGDDFFETISGNDMIETLSGHKTLAKRAS